jgi:hypothetical protein
MNLYRQQLVRRLERHEADDSVRFDLAVQSRRVTGDWRGWTTADLHKLENSALDILKDRVNK